MVIPIEGGSTLSFSPPDSGRIRCVCEYDEDDGFTIQCEQCLVWQHAKCVGISKNSVPEQYFCEECNPGWHENLHNLALQAINLDLINTGSAINKDPQNPPVLDVNILEDSPSNTLSLLPTIRGSFKRKITMPLGVPALNEVSENIISTEAGSVIESFLRGINVQRLKRQQAFQDLNFEFQSTVLFDSLDQLALLQKSLEVREIRNRGYQKKGSTTKYGLFATEQCDPGHFVCEFIGHVQQKNLLTIKGAKEYPVSVTQSFVLYPLASVDLAVDARKFGSGARYVRRSCRPNVQIKPVIIEGPGSVQSLSWGLFARNIIKSNSEIFLPLDYQCGNGLFRYECACNAPDFCLGPLDNFLSSTLSANNTSAAAIREASNASGLARASSPKLEATESAELEALGIRRSSSAIIQDSSAVPAVRPILDTRKMTREERKLQKYIEYFEKMDSADAAKKVHPVASSSNSSLGTSSRKGSSSGSSPQHHASRISSPEKVGGLKKAWKQLSSSGSSIGVDDGNEDEDNRDFNKISDSRPPAKRGRKPSTKPTQMPDNSSLIPSANEEINVPEATSAVPSSPLKPKPPKSSSKRKKTSDSKKFDIEAESDSTEDIDIGIEIGSGSATTKSISSDASKKPKLAKPKKKTSEPVEVESFTPVMIDIERSSSAVSVVLNDENHNRPNSAVPEASTSQPDTPSKKKLSLSDYLKKKKASPAESVPLNFDEDHQNDSKRIDAQAEQFSFLNESVIPNVNEVHSLSRRASSHSYDHLERGDSSNYISNHHVNRDRSDMSNHQLYRDRSDINIHQIERNDISNYHDIKNDQRDNNYISMKHSSSIDNNYDQYGNSSHSRSHHHSQSRDALPLNTDTTHTASSSSLDRRDRDKEFDRLQREREFERREAERERERRERERFREHGGGGGAGFEQPLTNRDYQIREHSTTREYSYRDHNPVHNHRNDSFHQNRPPRPHYRPFNRPPFNNDHHEDPGYNNQGQNQHNQGHNQGYNNRGYSRPPPQRPNFRNSYNDQHSNNNSNNRR